MNWDDLRLFLAVAREGRMLGAAQRLGISQARLSRHMAALEAATGTRLLERTTRGSALTPEGEAMLAHAERMEAEALAGLEATRGGGALSGNVRIGAPDGFGSLFLAPRLPALRAAHPGLRVQLVPVPRAFSLSEREADLAVMVGRPEKGRLRVRRLVDYTLGLYASEGYLVARSLLERVEDLRGHTLVGYVEDLLHTPELNYAREVWRDWRSSVEVATAVGQVEAVAAGAGIGVLHDFMAAGRPGLCRVLPDRAVTRTYWMVWHENVARAPRVQAAADFLAQAVRAKRGLFRPEPDPSGGG